MGYTHSSGLWDQGKAKEMLHHRLNLVFATFLVSYSRFSIMPTQAMMLRAPLVQDLRLAASLGLDADEPILNRTHFQHLVRNAKAADVPAEYATLPIDHEDPSVGTYQNRYWVVDDVYQPGSPVFVYDVGEADASDSAEFVLTSPSFFFRQFMEEFHALGIVWEHRYYGESLPFPVNLDTPMEHFKYLSNRQALADLPAFARNFSREALPDQDLTPSGTPWVMMGGSYAGMRSAFTRNEYPDVIFAAFASSAPVEARINMSVYFEQVYRGMVANNFGNCAGDLHAANIYIDQQLAQGGESATEIKSQFLGPQAVNSSNEDFTAALASIYTSFQSYGMGDGSLSTLSGLCTYLESNSTATPGGLAPVYGNQAVTERLASWPMLVPIINGASQTNCQGLDQNQTESCQLDQRMSDPDMISWTWQYCTEWGYFHSDNKGPHSLLSQYQTLDYNQAVCYRQFPGGRESGVLPVWPRVDAANRQTGGWTMRPSNVYWSGGEFDPWLPLSPLSRENNSFFATPTVSNRNPRDSKNSTSRTNTTSVSHRVQLTTAIPACNVSTREDQIFGYIMPNAAHCYDLSTVGFGPGVESRGYLMSALKEWLTCF